MNSITYTKAKERLGDTMDQVCDDHSPVVVTRENGQSVVKMSLEDYKGLEQTAYLLRHPANAQRLGQAIKDVESGNVRERTVLE